MEVPGPGRAAAGRWGARWRTLAAPGLLAALVVAPLALAAARPAIPAAPQDVLTYHGDLLRTGWQSAETVLTPQGVGGGGFGELWTSPALDGDLYGQPLYVAGVPVGGSPHNVVYVATEADTLWALDAHTGAVLWGPVRVGTPVPLSALECGDINPVGITGTPVADPAADALYAVAMTSPDGGKTLQDELVGVRLTTGAALPGFPVQIAPAVPGGPAFDARVEEERGALTLLPGGSVLDVPFGGFDGDCGDYRGWIAQIWLPDPTHQADYVTPTTREGGIWGAGGLAFGPEGALFGVTGNSDGSSPLDMGDAVLRLLPSPHLTQPPGPAGFFAPSNAVALDRRDEDLGTAGPLLLPAQPGPYPYLAFTMGKQGVGYLVDRWYPGGSGTGNGIQGEGVFSTCMYGNCQSGGAAVFSTAAYYTSGGQSYVLTAGITGQQAPCTGTGGLEAWAVHTGPTVAAPSLALAWCGPSMSDPGSPTVSSAGTAGAVAWIIDAGAGRLLALDAADGHLLWQDSLPAIHRFTVPTVADGLVFVPTERAVMAFGLR